MCPSCIPAVPFLAGTVSSGGLIFGLICGLRTLLAKLRGRVSLHLKRRNAYEGRKQRNLKESQSSLAI